MLSTLEKILFIQQIDLFREFTASELGVIAQKSMEKGYSRGDIVFRQGDEGDSLYIILGGRVRVVQEKNGEKHTLAILENKACFGEMSILSDEERSATIEAVEPLTLLKIKKKDFRDLIMKKPDMAFPIFRILIERIRNANTLYLENRAVSSAPDPNPD